MAICVLGDIHFRDDKDYWLATCEAFLDFFKKWEYNSSENTLLLAGDLVERNLLTGRVAEYLERFISLSKFKSIEICVGNHDTKKQFGENQCSYEFFRNKPNVHLYKNPTILSVEDHNILILPYFTGTNALGYTMQEYYSNLYKNKEFKDTLYDLILGHFSQPDCSFPGATDCISNLEKLKASRILLGHIHTRNINPHTYTGSIFAGKRNENDYTRAAHILENGIWKEEKLPLFNEFLIADYSGPLPESSAIVPIYTITNCASERLAKEKFGNIYVRKVISNDIEWGSIKKEELDRRFTSIKDVDIHKLFEDFVNTQDPPFTEEVVQDCNSVLMKS